MSRLRILAFVLHGVAGAQHVEVQIDAGVDGVLEVELVEGGTALKTSRPERTSSSAILRRRSTSRSSCSASRSEPTPMDRPQREALFSVSSSIPPPKDVHADLDCSSARPALRHVTLSVPSRGSRVSFQFHRVTNTVT